MKKLLKWHGLKGVSIVLVFRYLGAWSCAITNWKLGIRVTLVMLVEKLRSFKVSWNG